MQLMLVKHWILLMILNLWIIEAKRTMKFLPVRSRTMLRQMKVNRQTFKPKICFDLVGCFADPLGNLAFQKPPEHPSVIQTRFLLYTRSNRETPESLHYGDDFKSIHQSRFNSARHLKVVIHGYKGSGSDVGAMRLVQSLLDLEDLNVLVIDWTRGAATTYSAAVANTELVGRQLGLVLLDAVNLGTLPENIHVIGFSLGAHVAGCASEILKKRKILLGRITGLDPASPFFRNHLFREKSRKLDATDAQLVDVIHTDGSEDFADGFGLLKPLGHVDFFPNGGREQPGCSDVKNSVVYSHLNGTMIFTDRQVNRGTVVGVCKSNDNVSEDMLTKEIACSHLRAWSYFLESVHMSNNSCNFTAWPCPKGRKSYTNGMCFPMESTMWSQEMGYGANRGPLGIYYLPTTDKEPFCGQPLRATVITSKAAPETSGMLFIKIMQRNSTINYRLRCAISNRRNKPTTFYNIAAAEYQLPLNDQTTMNATIWYEKSKDEDNEETIRKPMSDALLMNKIVIEDRKGNKWEYCSPNTAVNLEKKIMILRRQQCDIS